MVSLHSRLLPSACRISSRWWLYDKNVFLLFLFRWTTKEFGLQTVNRVFAELKWNFARIVSCLKVSTAYNIWGLLWFQVEPDFLLIIVIIPLKHSLKQMSWNLMVVGSMYSSIQKAIPRRGTHSIIALHHWRWSFHVSFGHKLVYHFRLFSQKPSLIPYVL